MANELTLSVNMSFLPGDRRSAQRVLSALGIDVAGLRKMDTQQLIGTVEEAIGLGELATLGWAWFQNLDPTNYIELRTGTGATKFAKLLPNEACVFRFGSGITAPFAIANTAACYLDYVIWEI